MTEVIKEAYVGPAYWMVVATTPHSFDLVNMHGHREATYPNAELAHKVRKDKESKAMRLYLRNLKKQRMPID